MEEFDISTLAEATSGFSGSEIEQVVISALYDAFDAGEELSQGRLLASAKEVIPLSHTMKERLDGMREWAKSRARNAASRAERNLLDEGVELEL